MSKLWLATVVAMFCLAFGVTAWHKRTRPPPAAQMGLEAKGGAASRPDLVHVTPNQSPPGPAPAPLAFAPSAPIQPVAAQPPERAEQAPRLPPPGPAIAGPRPLAGVPPTGTNLPVTPSADEIRRTQIERLIGLREMVDPVAGSRDGKAGAARTEVEEKLAALESWALAAAVRPDEIAAARERLAARRQTATARHSLDHK